MPASDFTFDGDNKYIIISSGVTNVDVQDMYSRWKQWTITSENSRYLQAFRTFGGDPTIAGQFAPKYYFLKNEWRVFIDNDELVSVGTNLYTEELVSPYIVGTGSSVSDSNSDAVVVDNGIAQSLDYNGIVHINTDIGIVGDKWPIGTIAQPVNNLVDAKVIADLFGINTYNIYGPVVFDVDLNNSNVYGGNLTDVIDLQGVNVSGTTFKQCLLKGSYSGNMAGDNCILFDGFTGMEGFFQHCGMQGKLYFSEGVNCDFFDGASQVPGNNSPSIFLNTNVNLSLRKYSGGLNVYNCGSGATISLEFMAGDCRLLSGNTAGEIEIRGIAKFTDNSSGSTIGTGGLLIPYTVAHQHTLNVNTEITKNK